MERNLPNELRLLAGDVDSGRFGDNQPVNDTTAAVLIVLAKVLEENDGGNELLTMFADHQVDFINEWCDDADADKAGEELDKLNSLLDGVDLG